MAQPPSEIRSRTMRAVKSRDTTPELLVRRMVHAMGKRYRLHRNDLPGKPDLTFPRLKKIIFVHGCFWHGHDCQRGARVPNTNRTYWIKKITSNRVRDEKNQGILVAEGWRVLVIWECQLKSKETTTEIINEFLR